MENKETSIQWLMSQAVNWARNTNSGNDIVEFPKGAIKQAKEMEKEQIMKSVNDTIKRIKLDEDKTGFIAQNGEGYFNETYGGNK
jgi:hypothetical protein